MTNPFEIPDFIDRYIADVSSEEDEILKDLYRTTNLKTCHPQMLSGKVQGKFLSMISMMHRPKRILEIGTFTGYSAYCLSKGLAKDGKLITVEVNEELEELIQNFFNKAGIADKTELIIGDAQKIIPNFSEGFDLIFLDANKEHYPDYYPLIKEKLNPGGILLADNVLWGGKVALENIKDRSSQCLDKFNQLVRDDKEMESVMLTIRDGILMARRVTAS